ncbi:MAG: hypothetical protein NTW75_08225 [Planctomycetales bacterium]|nr:hypothetical protein [Planctomycetales bacterium]
MLTETFAMGLVGARCWQNKGQPINSIANWFFPTRILCDTNAIVAACLAAVLTLAQVPCAFGDDPFYLMTVHNNFGKTEFYGVQPTNDQIYLATDWECDYLTLNKDGSQNWTPATYSNNITVFPLPPEPSPSAGGNVKIYYGTGQSQRMCAFLWDKTARTGEPSTSDISTSVNPIDPTVPFNYMEWDLAKSMPGALDLTWIDRWDFLTRMEVSKLANGGNMVYGARLGTSTEVVGKALSKWASQTQYNWLKGSDLSFPIPPKSPPSKNPPQYWSGGFSSTQAFNKTKDALVIPSLTQAMDRVIAEMANSKVPGTSSTKKPTNGQGPNWTKDGFRIAYPYSAIYDPAGNYKTNIPLYPKSSHPQPVVPCPTNEPTWNSPAPYTVTPPDYAKLTDVRAFSCYVGFSRDLSLNYTMTLSDFTLYNPWSAPMGGCSPLFDGSFGVCWTQTVDDPKGNYKLTQAQGLFPCIWANKFDTSLVNNQRYSPLPLWVNNLQNGGSNADEIIVSVFNALSSGVIFDNQFKTGQLFTNATEANSRGFVPMIPNDKTFNYNFETFTDGANVSATFGRKIGNLTGQQMISLLQGQGITQSSFPPTSLSAAYSWLKSLPGPVLPLQPFNPYALELLKVQEQTPAYLTPGQDEWKSFGTSANSVTTLGLQPTPLSATDFGPNAKFDWYLGGQGKGNPGQ